ncbi:MAG: lipoate--protein ligase family protein [Desulfurococcales archaeon]|nr:lipoate--protein ligase family protein [Desulfurococcales archaeon]
MEFRVIIHGPMDPRFNMAIDEALLLSIKRHSRPILRLYMWKPTGVSIGRKQDPRETVNIDRIEEKGYVLVRRPTGGAALLHGEGREVTYSLVVPKSNELYSLSIEESASRIAMGIAMALERLGINARIGGFAGFNEKNLCYLRVGASDITVNGRKISGSAQVRTANGLLQHGTLLIDMDYSDWIDVIKTSFGIKELRLAITSLQDLGVDATLDRVLESLINGFSKILNMTPAYSSITPAELAMAYRLYNLKYSRDEWNMKGIQIEYLNTMYGAISP